MTTTTPPETTFLSQTPFRTALVVHSGQPACPTPDDRALPSWYPDDKYQYCCQTQSGAVYIETLTSGPGPGGRSLTACCQRSFLCTGAAPFVYDWSISTEVVSLGNLVRSIIVTFPLTTTPADGGANGVPGTVTETATVTVTTSPAIVVGGEDNSGRLTNEAVIGIVVGVAGFIIAVGTSIVGLMNPPVWLQPMLRRLGIAVDGDRAAEARDNGAAEAQSGD